MNNIFALERICCQREKEFENGISSESILRSELVILSKFFYNVIVLA